MNGLRRLLPNLVIAQKLVHTSSTCSRILHPVYSTYNTKTMDTNTTNETITSSLYPKPDEKDEEKYFHYLLRTSNFINMGDPENKVARGKIFHVVNDDLYIDFGWKFYCVCPRPTKSAERYVRGATVILLIKSLEVASKFLGSRKELTLLEADAILLGLVHSPVVTEKEN